MRTTSLRLWVPRLLALAAASVAVFGGDRLEAKDCYAPNQTSFGVPDSNVQRAATSNVTSATLEVDVAVPVAALIGGGSRAVLLPFTFTGADRAYRVTVDFPLQTFDTSPARYVGLAEIVGDVAQCDQPEIVFDPNNPPPPPKAPDKNTPFVSPESVALPKDGGKATLETKLRGGRTYQVELVYIFEKVEPGRFETFHVKIEPIAGSGGGGGGGTVPPPPPTVPVVQPFFKGCTKTAKEYLDQAVTLEETAEFTMRDDRISLDLGIAAVESVPDDPKLQAALAKTRLAAQTHAQGARAQLRTSKVLLACVKERVAADESIPAGDKAYVLGKVDEAIARDDGALGHLNAPDFGSTVAGVVRGELQNALDDVNAAVLAKRAAGRTLDAAIKLGLEKAAAAQTAGLVVDETVRSFVTAVHAIATAVKKKTLTPAAVAGAQNAETIGQTTDEVRAGIATTRGAGIAQVQVVLGASSDPRVQQAGAKAVAHINKTGDRFDGKAQIVAERAQQLTEAAAERDRFGKNAAFLEKRLIDIGLGKVKGEKKGNAYYKHVLNEVNRFRRLAGFPPLDTF
jgi:hypothetical protein